MVGRDVIDIAAGGPKRPVARLRALRRRKRLGIAGTLLAWGLSGAALLWLVGAGVLSLGAG